MYISPLIWYGSASNFVFVDRFLSNHLTSLCYQFKRFFAAQRFRMDSPFKSSLLGPTISPTCSSETAITKGLVHSRITVFLETGSGSTGVLKV